jgi:adenosylcobyric acid synthase
VIGIYQNNVYGTYLHGIFCHDELRRSLLNSILQNKKITASQKFRYKIEKEKSIRHLAELVRKNLDVKYIYKLMGL